jgi:flagellar basal body-associated protein FliL
MQRRGAGRRQGKLFAMIGAAVLVLGLGGGAGWYFMHGSSAEAAAEPAKKEHGWQQEKEEGRASARIPGRSKPFTVNLQPENGDQYLQVAFTLQVDGAEQVELIKANMAKVRSRVLLLLSGKKHPRSTRWKASSSWPARSWRWSRAVRRAWRRTGSLGRPVHFVHHPVSQ